MHNGNSASPALSSTTSKESSDRGYKSRFNLAFHLRNHSSGRRSASSSVYEASINANDGQDIQKENVTPRSRPMTPSVDDYQGASISQPQKSSPFGPLLRRARSNLTNPTSTPSSVQGTKWDEFRDEPTMTPSGKSAQVKPSSFNDPFGSNPYNYGVQVSITGGPAEQRLKKKKTLTEIAAKFGREALPEVRPSWKGASGRSAIVDPVRDTAQRRPQKIYTVASNQGDMSRDNSREGSLDGVDVWNDETESPCLSENGNFSMEGKSNTSFESIEPPPPLQIVKPRIPMYSAAAVSARKPLMTLDYVPENQLPAPSITTIKPAAMSPTATPQTQNDSSISTSTDGRHLTAAVARTYLAEPRSHFSWSTYAESVAEDEEDKGLKASPSRGENSEQSLASRFSWSTVATNTTYQQDTPPTSPIAYRPRQHSSPIMLRRRPVPSSASASPAGTCQTRKQSMASETSESEVTTPRLRVDTYDSKNKTRMSVSSASTTDKALPLPPTLDKESTHIEALQAKSDELDLRVANIQKVMVELQKVDRASPLEVNEKMRRENKKKLEQIRTRLEEAQREKHEIGMALARARSRLQKEEGESSTLWLRRVTS